MNTQLPRNHSARSRKTLLLWLGIGGTIFVLLAISLLLGLRVVAESLLQKKLTALEASGVPISLEEVNRRYHEHGHDPADNAAPLYEQAFARRVTDDLPMEEVAKALRTTNDYHPVSEETLEAVNTIVTANQEAIELFKEAAARPFLRFDLDFTEGYALLIPHVSELREGARLLSSEAVLAAENDEVETAVNAIRSIFQIARHIADEPLLISQLTAIAIEFIGRSALERVIERMELPSASLNSLQADLRASEARPRLKPALGTEIAVAGSAYREVGTIREWMDQPSGERAQFILYRTSGMLARDHHFFLTRMEDFLRVLDSSGENRSTFEKPWEGHPCDFLQGQVIASILLPSMDRVIEAETRSVTALHMTQIALAAEQYRLDEGRFPSAPDDLVPDYLSEIPADHYSSEGGFRFIHEADAFHVRSSGTFPVRDKDDLIIQFRLPAR